MPSKKAMVINALFIISVVVGTRFGMVVVPYMVIGAFIIVGVLTALNKIRENDYMSYLLGLSLCSLLETSLLSNYLVGSDIHNEYYVSSIVMQNGLDWDYPHQYITSIVVSAFLPFLSQITHIDLVWVYKVVPVLFLAIVPVLAFIIYRHQFGAKRAFWAAMFLMIVPVMTVELVGNAKASISEVMFMLAILVLISDLRQLYKAPILIICVMLTLLSHYTVGIVLLCVLGAILFGKVLIIVARKQVVGKISVFSLAIVLCIALILGYFYYSNVMDGRLLQFVIKMLSDVAENMANRLLSNSDIPGLVSAGLGLDFMLASTTGKIFRIVQYITELLLLIGLIGLWCKRNALKVTSGYAFCIIAGFVMLGISILSPVLASVINMTRVYHMSLLFIAPLFVLGVEIVARKYWLPILSSILLVYFVFTSGLMFELTKSEVTFKVEIPYSLALSGERTGIVGVFTDGDMRCAEWIKNNSDDELPVLTDVNAGKLLEGMIIPRFRLYAYYGDDFLRWSLSNNIPLSGSYYVFFTAWNIDNGKLLELPSSYVPGAREVVAISDKMVNANVVYESGHSKVYLMKGTME